MGTSDLKVPNYGLTLQDQVELGRRMVVNGDSTAREKLILNCVPVVKALAKTPFFSNYSNYEDNFQEGMIGVLEAIDKYDYTKNVKFTSYAYSQIHKRIVSSVRKQLPLKVTEKDFFNSLLIETTVQAFQDNFNVEPTNEQIAELSLIPLPDVIFLRNNDFRNATVSQDALLDDKTHDSLFLGDVAVLIERCFKSSARNETVIRSLEVLDADEKDIIQKRYLAVEEKTTLKELAEAQNVSVAGIVKREKRALRKLLNYFVSNNILFTDLIE